MRRIVSFACAAFAAVGLAVAVPAFVPSAGASDPAGSTYTTLGTTSYSTPNSQCAAANAKFSFGDTGYGPVGVAVGPQGQLFVTDDGGDRVLEWTSTAALSSCQAATVIGAGMFDGSGNGAEAVAVNSDGLLAVASTGLNHIFLFTPTNGVYSTPPVVLGSNAGGGSGSSELQQARGLAFIDKDTLAVADDNNNRVDIFKASPTGFTTGQAATTTFNGGGVLASVKGITASGNNLYVTDFYNTHIYRFTAPFTAASVPSAVFSVNATGSQTNCPIDLVVAPDGSLLVTELDIQSGGNADIAVFPNADAATGTGPTGTLPTNHYTVGPQSTTTAYGIAFDSAGRMFWADSANLRVVIETFAAPTLTITSGAPSAGTVNTAYPAFTETATGGTGTDTWSLGGGALPTGLTLSSAGVISGTPTATGTFTFTVSVHDAGTPQQVATKSQSITVNPATLTVTSGAPNSGTVGTVYSNFTETAAGGTGADVWSIGGGSLPNGLSMTSAGVINGTPTVAGTFTFTVSVHDSGTPQQVATKSQSITINPATLTITSGTPGAGVANSAYPAFAETASGGTGADTWSIGSGALPTGLTLSSAGVISGTPTATGTFTFTVSVHDSGTPQQVATQAQSITINAGALPLTITSGTPAAGTVNAAYSPFTETASGGTGTDVWSIASGTLPSGLTLSSAGVISGTPSAPGTFTFTVSVHDSGTPQQVATKSQSITINPATLTITSGVLPAGTVGSAYSTFIESASGGTGAYTWSLSSGTLPTGLTISSAGAISGTTTAAGTFNFTVGVHDAGTPQQTATRAQTITVNTPTIAITTGTLPPYTVNAASIYSFTETATGGTGANVWYVSAGSLPAGLHLSSATGVISGSPTNPGTTTFTMSVHDSGTPQQSTTRQQSITISIAPLAIPASLPAGRVNGGYDDVETATGGFGAYTWSFVSGTLPSGLSLNSSGGFDGYMTTKGLFTFTVKVVDSSSPQLTATKTQTLQINDQVLGTLPQYPAYGTIFQPFQTSQLATGGTGAYTWSLSAGSLPAGLSLSTTTGGIGGTPTVTGTFNVTLSVHDAGSPQQVATAQQTIVVNGTTLQFAVSPPTPHVGEPYSFTEVATGGTPPYTYSFGGSLPAGLTFSGNRFSGTPTGVGSNTIVASVHDSASPQHTLSVNQTLVVYPATLRINVGGKNHAYSGSPFTFNYTATGGQGAYTWFISSGSLPAGLTLSSAGVVSGTPTAVGNSSVVIGVHDSAASVTQTVTVADSYFIDVPDLAATSLTLPNGQKNVAYSFSQPATGGRGLYTWALTQGFLPPGLTLSNAGVISGTPTSSGTYRITESITDEQPQTRFYGFTLTITGTTDPDYNLSTLGTVGIDDPTQCAAATARFAAPYSAFVSGVAIANSGRIFVIDGAGNRVLSWPNADALAQCQSADEVIGAGLFATPEAITVGPDNTLYVSDVGNEVVDIFTPNPSGVYPAGPSVRLGQLGVYGTGLNQFASPRGLALTAQGQLAVVNEADATVQIFNAPFANGESAIRRLATGPGTAYALAVSGNNLYVSNVETSQIRRFTGPFTATSSNVVTARFTTDPANTGSFLPVDMTVTPTGSLMVTTLVGPTASYAPGQVQVFPNANFATATPAPGIAHSSVVAFGGQPIGLGAGIVQDAAGRIFIADPFNSRVVIATPKVAPPALLNIAPGTIPTLARGYQFNAQESVTNPSGGGPYTWTITGGSLPSGLTMTSSGQIIGAPDTLGTYTFDLNVHDSSSPQRVGFLSETVTVATMAITNTALPDATVEAVYSAKLTEQGGKATFVWSLAPGSVLPPGLKLSTAGAITGTVTCQGPATGCAGGSGYVTFNLHDATVPNNTASRTYYLNVLPTHITSSGLAPGTINVAYPSTKLTAVGGGTLTWSLQPGESLPPGLKLATTGTISGTPTMAGGFDFGVLAKNAKTGAQFQSATATIHIYIAPMHITSTVRITSVIYVQKAFPAFSEKATGAKGTTHWSVGAGALPPGLKLTATTGQITGTPTTPGSYAFTIHVSDSATPTANEADTDYTVDVLPMIINDVDAPNGSTGKAYSFKVNVTGGKATVVFGLAAGSSLPPGLKVSTAGQISGTPTLAGNYSFVIQATDKGVPVNVATRTFNIVIA